MDAETLLDTWERNQHRPQWVIDAREQIAEHTNLNESIPRRKSELQSYMAKYKGVITRQLKAAAEDGESDNTDADQEGDS